MTTAQVIGLYDLLHAGITITVRYATGGESVKTRTITPLKLWHHDNARDPMIGCDLVSAFDSLRGEHRAFRVDRIQEVIAIHR